MANEIDHQKRYEEAMQQRADLLEGYSKVLMQYRSQRTKTVIVGVGAAVVGVMAGYVAGVLRVGR